MIEINTGGAEQELIEQLQDRVAELERINKAKQFHLDGDEKEIDFLHKKVEQLESDLSGCIKLIAKYEAERHE